LFPAEKLPSQYSTQEVNIAKRPLSSRCSTVLRFEALRPAHAPASARINEHGSDIFARAGCIFYLIKEMS
jgi:hypothetical protein